jgi:hypothetical protein
MSVLLAAIALASFSNVQGQSGPSDMGSGRDLQNGREAPAGTAGEGNEANGERRICRRIPTSRSHMYRRVCLTAEQWRQQQD